MIHEKEEDNWHQPRSLILVFFAIELLGCVSPREDNHHLAAPQTTPQSSTRHLENAQPSERALAEMVLLALKEKDASLLASLRVTEREYKEILFPEFPAAQPGSNLPVDFHWQHLDIRSRAGIEEALSQFGGEDYELLEVIPTQGIDEYKTFKVLKKVQLKVVRKKDGEVSQIRVFGSVVELDGQYKIIGFPT